MTLFVVADVTVVGFAISSQIAGIIFIGTLFPILIYYAMNRIYSISIPILYTAIYIENKFGGNQVDWLASTYITYVNSVAHLDKIRGICNISDPTERAKQLRSLKAHVLMKGKGLTRASLVIVSVAQLVTPFFSLTFIIGGFFRLY